MDAGYANSAKSASYNRYVVTVVPYARAVIAATLLAVEIDRTSATPTYQQVAAILRDRITAGEYKPGDQLPSVHSLVMETGLADATVRAAIRVLRDEGLVRTAPGRGVFVVPRD